MGRSVGRAGRGHRHRPGQHHRPGDHPSGFAHRSFVERATTGFDAFARSVEEWTLERGEEVTGVPAWAIRELAESYAQADRAQLCWTLGITEHHNGTDNVLALINLALLCGHVGRYGSGLSPLRGQNNVQGGGDMGAIPDHLPGFADLTDPAIRAPFDAAWQITIPPRRGMHLSQMFEAMGDGRLGALYVVGENPAQSEADATQALERLGRLELLIVQDIVLTRTAQLADVVLPATASWCEAEGTVTNSERRVQRVRKAVDGPLGARDDADILCAIAARLGHPFPAVGAEAIWDELRTLSPIHRGMSYERLERLGGIQWPCFDEHSLTPSFLHGRLWAEDPNARGTAAAFTVVEDEGPIEALDDDVPAAAHHRPSPRLVQHGGTEHGAVLAIATGRDGRSVGGRCPTAGRGRSRGGAGRLPSWDRRGTGPHRPRTPRRAHVHDDALSRRRGHQSPDHRRHRSASGTAEFKAAAVRIEKLPTP